MDTLLGNLVYLSTLATEALEKRGLFSVLESAIFLTDLRHRSCSPYCLNLQILFTNQVE